ncbi:endonuclease/exonuclease/phosphatase family metal-dependent hydrolase [Parabacteroides sp. PF5-5]|uniref:endonuclease/exonuclease/phosphatase family protein n=1 Tax=unclassified Parabacteroides TaxID=2649774 RepID=UPI0024765E2C|nr:MULTISPECIES: endonuclease/exonuclease/phosphatase family protein [unclassified Parabacteroides]MDH6304969.1 endonuclease/exonuclease/phosphatase family metal-dependent hydrolase [Parabacteroides sp. PH5-39]MDH6315945.1 endonuclease/exonuclease/phosphatase family metal-dependent hydrolase [Parabacteroides sp. PF5-13]MDH6319602.1 endonuclease/exonuclease/phosphatase family metal-dependent hydrolase [Parabacteroides sp. PH5-13]MDH6323333.1 endonuclease/exonuclease/phosphatase family metal-depe
MPAKNKGTGKGIIFFKSIIQYFFVIANVLAALLLIVSAYSDYVSPNRSLFFSYIGLIFPFICLMNACFLVYWIILHQWKFLLIGVIAFVVCWKPVRSYFPLHIKSKPVPEEGVIKVLTYNVMGFAYKDHTKEEPNEIVRYIINSEADIVCLQECHINKSKITEKKLNNALGMYPYHSFVPLQSKNWGLAVYSKFPILKSRKIEYGSEYNGSAVHELDINGKSMTLINNHLESFKLTMDDKTRYSDFIKGVGPETFDELKGTIQRKLGPAFLIRAKQARIIADEIQRAKSDYLLVCGDFNDTPVSYAHRKIQGSLLDAFAESGRGLGVTYNQNFFWFRIDHILYSANMQAINCRVGHVKYSDHYPVYCYLKLEE